MNFVFEVLAFLTMISNVLWTSYLIAGLIMMTTNLTHAKGKSLCWRLLKIWVIARGLLCVILIPFDYRKSIAELIVLGAIVLVISLIKKARIDAQRQK
jgi:hypothetical protein